MQINITLFSEKKQGAFIRGGAFIRISKVPVEVRLGFGKGTC